MKFAEELKNNPRQGRPRFTNPAVLGAVIDLGECLDLVDSEYLDLVKESYKIPELSYQVMGKKLPENKKVKILTTYY